MGRMEPVLTVENLSVAFDGHVVIENLSFEVPRGENISVIGPNGSGKTVLLRALLGTLPYTGRIVWTPGIRFGYVPQKIDADRHLPLNVRDLLIAKIRVLGLPKSALAEVAENVALAPKILGTPMGHLSGGQFQKSLIAFALLGNPGVILFDEPTASLDQLAEEHVYEIIHDLQERYGITILIVSHDLSMVYRYATKVLCLNKHGLCYGDPQEVLTPGTLEKLYGTPHKYYHHAAQSEIAAEQDSHHHHEHNHAH